MKFIKTYNQFLNESAGLEFYMNDIEVTIYFNITKDKVRITNTYHSLPLKFYIGGYDNEMDDVKMDDLLMMKDSDLKYTDMDFLYNMRFFMDSTAFKKLENVFDIEVDDMVDHMDKSEYILMKELFELDSKAKIKGEFSIDFSTLEYKSKKGFVRPSGFKTGEILIIGDSATVNISNMKLVLDKEKFSMDKNEIVLDDRDVPSFNIFADKKFNSFYNHVFNFKSDDDNGYDENRDMIKSKYGSK